MEWSNYTMLFLLLPTVLVCITTALVVIRASAQKRSRKLPPGPRGLPIIGHLHLLGKLPHRSLYELSKVNGPLMWLRLGCVPAVVASSPEMARQILQNHDDIFADRMPTAVVNQILGGFMDIAFSPPNAHWKYMRRLCITELFSTKRLEFFKPVRDEEIRLLTQLVLADSIDARKTHLGGKPVQCVRQKLLKTTNDIITRMMLGKRLSELDGRPEACGEIQASKIVDLLCETAKLLGIFNVGDYLPLIAWMDLQGCVRHSKRTSAALRAAIEGLIQARRLSNQDQPDQPPKDYLDLLLQASIHNPINIVNILQDLFGAGRTDTSSVTVEWALAELLMNPGKMRAAQAEMDEVVGKERIIEEGDIAHLPYLVACVKETMRLHPVVPLLIPHKTNQACEVLGFHIPANTVAYVNVWAIGRDSKVWESSTQFLPERFLGATASCSNVDIQGHHFELLPFGSGRRICPGWRLGLLNVQIILARLLQGFEWSIPHSHQLDMSESFGLVNSLTTPLVAFTTPRLPRELY